MVLITIKYFLGMENSQIIAIIAEKLKQGLFGREKVMKEFNVSRRTAENFIKVAKEINNIKVTDVIVKDTSILDIEMTFMDFPEGDACDIMPQNLILNYERILDLSDIHFPYHELKALLVGLKYGKYRNVDCILLNGDLIDCYQQSSFQKSSDHRNFGEELKVCILFFKHLRQLFPNAAIIHKFGNHEFRHERYIAQNSAVLGIEDFELKNLLKHANFGIQYVPSNQLMQVGNYIVAHGHESKTFIRGGINAARQTAVNAGVNIIYQHLHRAQHAIVPFYDKIVEVHVGGCLCSLSPSYTGVNNWTNGFIFIETHNGICNVENIVLNRDFVIMNNSEAKRVLQGK